MATALRKTGISVVGDVPWGSHFCHFYETKQDLLDTLVPYFKAGLESREFCLWVVPDSELITVEEAKGALEQAVPDLDRRLSDENIEILSGLDWYLEEGVFNLESVTSAWDARLKRALALGYDGMRVSGDTFWLGEKDWKDFCAYEKQLNNYLTDQPMTVLCTYQLAKSGASEVLDVVQAHQFAIARRQGEWEVIQSPEPIQAKAEIRRLNEELQQVRDRTPKRPAILRYGVAVLSVSAAFIIAWLLQIQYGFEPFVPFICAMMVSAWFGGVRPGLLALALSLLAFHYYFLIPVYPLGMEKEIPRLVVAALTSLFVVLLSAAQGNAAESLRRARDVLYGTVQELKRTNVALQAENAERKEAEEALRRSENHLRRVIDAIPTMAWGVRPDGVVDSLNQRWVDYSGLSLEQYVEDPMGPIHPDDSPRVMKRWLAQMAVGEGYEDEMRLRRADGKYRWFMVRTAPLRDESGKIIKWYGVSTDIDDRKRAEEQLKATSAQLRALSARLSSVREEEGSRIARELHDELGAALTSLKWDLEAMSKRCSEQVNQRDYSVLREKIEVMMDLVDGILNSVRRISSELRPGILDDLGLLAAIEWQAKQFESRSGIACIVDLLVDDIELNREQSTAIFRILQEALTNVLRHAQASRVNILVEEVDGELILEVRDNGRGITEDEIAGSASLGLIGMQERAHILGGRIEVIGTAGVGTALTLQVPIHPGTSD